MAVYVYVDNSNLWIEGQRVAAARRDGTLLHQTTDLDISWRYDFGRLYQLACPMEAKLGRTALFGSTPPPTDSIWKRADAEGWDVRTFARNASNKEKQVDNAIGTLMLEDSFMHMRAGSDSLTLVAGDADFLPNLESIKRRGFPITVMFWSHAARGLHDLADVFFDLDPHLDFLAGT